MHKKIYLIGALWCAISVSCSKDNKPESGDDATQRYQKLLSSKPWKQVLVDSNPATTPKDKTVLYYAANNCELANTYHFFDNGYSLIIDQSASQCAGASGQKAGLNYAADFAKQEIIINAERYQLAELSETRLKYYRTVARVSGFTNEVYLFEH